nr:MAG TPA: hypothetical protein [Caudoviricetes sp.]
MVIRLTLLIFYINKERRKGIRLLKKIRLVLL